MKKYLFVLIVSLILTILLRKISLSIDYESYKDILSTLLNISSIVFAIIGAWIAIIYPKAIGKVFNKSDSKDTKIKIGQDNDGEAYISELVEIAFVSSIVLMCVLIIQFSLRAFKILCQCKQVKAIALRLLSLCYWLYSQ